jgi:hypothetical protein
MVIKAKIMEPKKKVTNGDQDSADVTSGELEAENKKISERIIASESHMPDVTGLNMDTAVVNHGFDEEEM